MKLNKYDVKVINFVNDAMKVLKIYDKKIKNNLYKSYYCVDEDWKGIGVYSVTEPIIKFIIFSELCDKYIIYPEKPYDEDTRKHMDLAMYIDKNKFHIDMKNDQELAPPIAIEIKWAGITKRKRNFNDWSRDALESIFQRLNKYTNANNKYAIQIGFIEKETFDKDFKINNIKSQIKEMDQRIVGNLNPRIITEIIKFKTEGENKEPHYFFIILWKI